MSKKLNGTVHISHLKNKIDPDPVVKKLKNDVQDLTKRLNNLKIQVGTQQDFFEEIKDLITVFDPPKLNFKNTQVDKKVSSPMSAICVLSDWHIGEVVEGDEIENFNQFNWNIAQRRVDFLADKLIELIVMNKTISDIDEVVFLCIGDLISGDIHDELKITNEFPVPEQVVRAAGLLSYLISKVSAVTSNIRVEFISTDNHSRISKKYQYKQGGLNSFDYLVGYISQQQLLKHTNVTFNLHATNKEIVRVKNTQYLCCHGHDIKGWAGFPYYGIDRVASKESKARMFKLDKQFHKLIIGHFHAPLNSPDWIINGSLVGTCELDHAYGRHANPCQLVWFVHPKFGEFCWNQIWLQHAE